MTAPCTKIKQCPIFARFNISCKSIRGFNDFLSNSESECTNVRDSDVSYPEIGDHYVVSAEQKTLNIWPESDPLCTYKTIRRMKVLDFGLRCSNSIFLTLFERAVTTWLCQSQLLMQANNSIHRFSCLVKGINNESSMRQKTRVSRSASYCCPLWQFAQYVCLCARECVCVCLYSDCDFSLEFLFQLELCTHTMCYWDAHTHTPPIGITAEKFHLSESVLTLTFSCDGLQGGLHTVSLWICWTVKH